MKRIVLLLAALLAVAVVTNLMYAGEGRVIRPNGASYTSGGGFPIVADSTDTFYVDTMTSDVITLDTFANTYGYNYAVLTIIRDTVELGDSANDSVVVINTIYTQDNLGYIKRVGLDTQSTTYSSPDTFSVRLYLNGGGVVPNKDSLLFSTVWIQTIIKDSNIIGTGYDTTIYKGRANIWFCK